MADDYYTGLVFRMSCDALLKRGHLEAGRWTNLYVVQDGDLVKFGVSKSPRARLSNMRVSNPRDLQLLVVVPSTENLERFVHEWLAPSRASGEWFRRDEQVERVVEWLQGIRLALDDYDEDVDALDTVAWICSPAEILLEDLRLLEAGIS